MSQTPSSTAAPEEGEVVFHTDVDVEAELEEMKRQVDSMQEDLQLKTLQDIAAKEEGTRKTTTPNTSASSSHPSAAKSAASSVFVGGLEPRTTDSDLRIFFNGCGAVERITILKDRYSGRPKGTAYVEFASAEQAQAALLKDGQSLHGRLLKVAPKRENIPAFQRGLGPGGRGGLVAGMGMMGMGRGGAGAMGGPQGIQQQQQMAAMAMMATMMGGGVPGFSPFLNARGGGRGGRGGRGRGGPPGGYSA